MLAVKNETKTIRMGGANGNNAEKTTKHKQIGRVYCEKKNEQEMN